LARPDWKFASGYVGESEPIGLVTTCAWSLLLKKEGR
jgi:hypothetical protein